MGRLDRDRERGEDGPLRVMADPMNEQTEQPIGAAAADVLHREQAALDASA